MGIGVLPGVIGQALEVHALVLAEGLREPHDHWHLGLFLGGDAIGRTVQIHAVLTQTFAMVGHIQHGAFQIVPLLQPADDPIDEPVHVDDGVVVGVHQLFLAAPVDLVGVAGGREGAVLGRVTLVIGGPVAAHGVQHHQRVLAAFLVQDLIEGRQQDVIQTFTVATEFRQVQRGEVHGRCHVLAHALAARVVVQPGDVHAGTLQDVQQVVLARGPGVVVTHAVHVREHAGHGMGRRCAAAAHVVEVDDLIAPPGQQRRGLPRVAVQPPVLGASGLTHDQHDEMAVIVGLGLRHGQIQLHVRHACPVPASQSGPAGHDEVGRHDQVRHVPVVAEERGVILVEVPSHSADHQYRKDNQNSTLRNLLVPATVVDLHHEVQQRRHDTQNRDPPQVRRRHQATAFRPAGDQHIGEHVLVEVDVEEQ